MVMPWIPISPSAWRTSSSLKGLMIAVIIFMVSAPEIGGAQHFMVRGGDCVHKSGADYAMPEEIAIDRMGCRRKPH
jgi:hypothetical protein